MHLDEANQQKQNPFLTRGTCLQIVLFLLAAAKAATFQIGGGGGGGAGEHVLMHAVL